MFIKTSSPLNINKLINDMGQFSPELFCLLNPSETLMLHRQVAAPFLLHRPIGVGVYPPLGILSRPLMFVLSGFGPSGSGAAAYNKVVSGLHIVDGSCGVSLMNDSSSSLPILIMLSMVVSYRPF